MNITLTQNTAQCLRDVGWIGRTDVHNVCVGQVSSVPWGHWEWLGFGAGVVLAGISLGILVTLIFSIASTRNSRNRA